MPGKKPKERQRYMLRINDTLVEVTRERSEEHTSELQSRI